MFLMFFWRTGWEICALSIYKLKFLIMYAEVLDGTFYGTLPNSNFYYSLREIVKLQRYGEQIWVSNGNVLLESNSLQEVRQFCEKNGIRLVRRLEFYFLHRQEVFYEEGYEKLKAYAVPGDIRTELPIA